MGYIATVTSKGQVTIPWQIRDLLKIAPQTQLVFSPKSSQEAIIRKIPVFLSLRGSIRSKKKYSDKKADGAILQRIKKGYEKEGN